ncbi:OLC1v1024717C1 [Oldenlandia corymbosa var. corymbosa]|uniref:OLC1v1024717C1 n=1 Tax=Oldenlandia corymbosa var. corymbosa TaxID=529605 RepID=A0AAV1C313_OLDCO|nr:OLC1v1024717C1 [Oldenlandia corymbosa var. corymbosa]
MESRQDVGFQCLPDPQELCFSDSDSEMLDSFYHIPEVPPPKDLSDTASYVISLFIAHVPDYPPFDDVFNSPNSVVDAIISNSEFHGIASDVSDVLMNDSIGLDSDSPSNDNPNSVEKAFTTQMYYSSDDSYSGGSSCNRHSRSPPTLRGRKKVAKVRKAAWDFEIWNNVPQSVCEDENTTERDVQSEGLAAYQNSKVKK